MLERIAGRLLTGPLAFLAAGVYDICALLVAYWRHRAVQRLRGG